MLKSNPWYLGIAGKNPALSPLKSALGPPKSALGLWSRADFGGPRAGFFPESLGQGMDFLPKVHQLVSHAKLVRKRCVCYTLALIDGKYVHLDFKDNVWLWQLQGLGMVHLLNHLNTTPRTPHQTRSGFRSSPSSLATSAWPPASWAPRSNSIKHKIQVDHSGCVKPPVDIETKGSPCRSLMSIMELHWSFIPSWWLITLSWIWKKDLIVSVALNSPCNLRSSCGGESWRRRRSRPSRTRSPCLPRASSSRNPGGPRANRASPRPCSWRSQSHLDVCTWDEINGDFLKLPKQEFFPTSPTGGSCRQSGWIGGAHSGTKSCCQPGGSPATRGALKLIVL